MVMSNRMEETTAREIIYDAIQEILQSLFENGFPETWNFPNCVGAVNGKYVHIQALPSCGSHL